ncbi:MAG: saccharopine dehydrogenase NADP-binding domain-containing protein [Clostridia bacterium]|nr:saccharopine dehydrogenase NADP-binding domain-containing protein [Clostridia bacterium]
MGKKVLVLGSGAQGTAAARRLDQHPAVDQVICADYDKKAVDELVATMEKGVGIQVNAKDVSAIVEAAQGVDLLLNALPYEFAKNVLDAAIEAKTNYQDFAAGELTDPAIDDSQEKWIEDIGRMYNEYGQKFRENGKLAIIGTGSAPGLILVAARRAVRELDTCDTVNMIVYEGLEAERFMPFWWSPDVALSDMSEDGVAWINGEFVVTEGFSDPFYREYPEMEGKVAMCVEHSHDEPVYVGYNADTFFKGCRNAYFKYGGVGIDFAYPLKRAGLLSKQKEVINGREVIPFETVLAHIPAAPKYHEEIQEILDEGIKSEAGATVVECIGKKDGKDLQVEAHLGTPGIYECFEKFGLTCEQYITGQGGYLFSKLFVEDKYEQTGLISSDMLSEEQVDYYLQCADELDITCDLVFKEL